MTTSLVRWPPPSRPACDHDGLPVPASELEAGIDSRLRPDTSSQFVAVAADSAQKG